MAENESGTMQDTAVEAVEAIAWPEADEFVAEHYGLAGEITTYRDEPPSYFVRYEEVVCRLDFGSSAEELRRFRHEQDLLHHIRSAIGRVDAPEVLASQQGPELIALDGTPAEGDQPFARLFALPPGVLMPDAETLTPKELERLGAFGAQLVRDLSAADERESSDEPTVPLLAEEDLRQAGPQVVQCLRLMSDPAVRDPIAKATVIALRKVQSLGDRLRSQLIHHHPAGDSLVGIVTEDGWVPTGFCDPDALGEGWIVAVLAAICGDVLGAAGGTVSDILPVVKAFHAELPLNEAELSALWPLTLARIALKRAQLELDSTEADAQDLRLIRRQFDIASSADPILVEAQIHEAVDWPLPPIPEFSPLLPEVDSADIRLVDLSPASPLFAEGNWNDAEIDWRLLARIAWDTKMGATRFGEYRLSRGGAADADNLSLHVDFCLPAGVTVAAPFGGTITQVSGPLTLTSKEATLYLEGAETVLAEGTMLFAGDRIGSVAGAEGSVGGLRIRLARYPDIDPPLFANAKTAGLWERIVLSPSAILGLDVDAPSEESTEYVRGWKEFLFDAQGRRYIDLTGAAGLLGYGNPELAGSAYRQWLLLGGVPGTGIEREYQAALLQDMPGHLDTILALTDELQAMEIARQLAERLFDPEDGAVIADERRSGFWRSGTHFWSFQSEGIVPDIIVTGSPVPQERLAAVILSRKVLPEGLELPQPDASTVGCRMGLTVLDALEDSSLREHASHIGALLRKRLDDLKERHPAIIDIRGQGLSVDLQLSGVSAQTLVRALEKEGILLAPPLETDSISLTAPLCMSEETVDHVIASLSRLLPVRETERQPEPSKDETQKLTNPSIRNAETLPEEAAKPI
ncbi:aminotransferase class III-fold pyridoxal phosphate-dependent enzyme [Rhizobium helianthi]|uniref:Aminotransferase class III-fold pyridoxal phosphate-dependent enzyme n=1 Tax=Rhizobium helianthi TaxID=1132695 RepID=A0ABW4M924_9HYPH